MPTSPLPGQYVVVVTPTFGATRVLGPYPTPERAAGEGLNRFGPIVFGTPNPWRVVRVER